MKFAIAASVLIASALAIPSTTPGPFPGEFRRHTGSTSSRPFGGRGSESSEERGRFGGFRRHTGTSSFPFGLPLQTRNPRPWWPIEGFGSTVRPERPFGPFEGPFGGNHGPFVGPFGPFGGYNHGRTGTPRFPGFPGGRTDAPGPFEGNQGGFGGQFGGNQGPFGGFNNGRTENPRFPGFQFTEAPATFRGINNGRTGTSRFPPFQRGFTDAPRPFPQFGGQQ